MDLKETVAFTATVSTILQFLTGLQICNKIYKQKNTLDISGFPFVAGTVSCSFWLKYGFLTHDKAIINVNSVGLALQLTYLIFYYWYSHNKAPYQNQIMVAASILFTLLGYVKFCVIDEQVAIHQVGLMACSAVLVFCGAPLADLAQVLRAKNTSTLPLPLIFATFLVCLQWFFYGILLGDKFVQVPNFIGACISGFQLCLFAIYPSKPTESDRSG